jgi:CheY-like chemotaxis protein
MTATVRSKLLAIAVVATAALVAIALTGIVSAVQVSEKLEHIEAHHVPRVRLGPDLRADLERISRAFQDAVAAQDAESLADVEIERATFDRHLAAATGAIDSARANELRRAMDDYQRTALDVSRRLLDGETGEDLVSSMEAMQEKRAHVADLVESVSSLRPGELERSFADAAELQESALRIQIWTAVAAVLLVSLLAWWVSRGLLRALGGLTSGFERFGRGELGSPIVATGGDELALVAERANEMAANLASLARAREHSLWLSAGINGLTDAKRGEWSPAEVAERSVTFLASYLGAIAGAVYYEDDPGAFVLLGSAGAERSRDGLPPSFKAGDGLLGRALAADRVFVVEDLPAGYLRIRSSLGEATPTSVVFVPLVPVDRARGVVELAFFGKVGPGVLELCDAMQRALALAIEAGRSRAASLKLLEETQAQAARLQLQEEELRTTNEELEVQQEELRQMNEELTQQTEALDVSRGTLEHKNAELERAQRALEQRASELATVSAYKSQFLTNMSHELRTPLNSMLLLSNLLSENQSGNLSDKQVGYCKTIYTAGSELLALINQVLDLARVEAGKTEINLETTNLRDITDHVRVAFEPVARHKGLELVVELDPGAPETITTDRQRLLQILNNLIANAIKFTEKGRVALRVHRVLPETVLGRQDLRAERAVAFEVSDSGPGIALEDQTRVFAPFEQASPLIARRHGGTGLGLAISRELAELLGGELVLRSTPGVGSTFVCHLPLSAEAGEASPAVPPRKSESTRPRISTLLVIEDDPTFADSLVSFIREQGLDVVVANNGEDGIRLALERSPVGIILDMGLPDIDGWTVLERLRANPATASIPVHCVSGAAGLERSLSMGAIGYVAKPASHDDLLRVIESLVPKRRAGPLEVLVVEDDPRAGDSLVAQLLANEVRARRVGSAKDALAAIGAARYDCIIVDLGLPDMDGLELLSSLDRTPERSPAVIVYTGRALSKAEARKLEAYAEAVVLKEGSSIERLLDEIRLFAGRLTSEPGTRTSAPEPIAIDERLHGKKILIVDDDMRTVYALSAMLRSKGFVVEVADNGRAGIEMLHEHPDLDLVLMDIMMPEMDGYAAISAIRAEARYASLPIIALTAKAMKGDEQKCMDVGASGYMPKPVDPSRLLRVLRTQLLAPA